MFLQALSFLGFGKGGSMPNRTKTLGLLAAIGLASAGTSHAMILNFDDVPSTENVRTSLQYGGYEFTSAHFHSYGDSEFMRGLIPYNGGTFLSFESGLENAITMTRNEAKVEYEQLFSLAFVDVAEFYAINLPDRPNANILQVNGLQYGGNVVSQQFLLDGIVDGRGGVADFQRLTFTVPFVELVAVQFVGLQFNGLGGGVSIDNIHVVNRDNPYITQPNDVPEPASLALFGAGLLGAGIWRRRQTK